MRINKEFLRNFLKNKNKVVYYIDHDNSLHYELISNSVEVALYNRGRYIMNKFIDLENLRLSGFKRLKLNNSLQFNNKYVLVLEK